MRNRYCVDFGDDKPTPLAFGDRLTGSRTASVSEARERADDNGAPVAVWHRDGWYTVCDVPPDCIAPDPIEHGWTIIALIDPTETESAS